MEPILEGKQKEVSCGKETPLLRVLFVSHTYIVGVNQGKLNAIAQSGGAEVGLLVPKEWNSLGWKRQLKVEQPYPHIKLYSAPIWFGGRVGAYFYPPFAILKAILDFRPDIIQVEQEIFSLSAFEVAYIAKCLNKPIVVFGWENMDRQLSPFRNWIRQFVMNTSQCIIAGNHDGASLVKQWGYRGLVEIMPQMGVDTKLFSPTLRSSPAVSSDLCIGFAGRLVHEKGVDTLIEAARILRDQNYRFCLMICGVGADEPKLKQQVQDYNLNDFIRWQGGVTHDEVPQTMSKMDVLVLPSRTIDTWKEQFGHVLIEAMAMGIPVVGSTCGEIPNVIGRSDLVFTEGDAKELAAILARLITEPDWRNHVQQYGLDRVAQHYSHERIAERLLALWRDILQQDRQLDNPTQRTAT